MSLKLSSVAEQQHDNVLEHSRRRSYSSALHLRGIGGEVLGCLQDQWRESKQNDKECGVSTRPEWRCNLLAGWLVSLVRSPVRANAAHAWLLESMDAGYKSPSQPYRSEQSDLLCTSACQ